MDHEFHPAVDIPKAQTPQQIENISKQFILVGESRFSRVALKTEQIVPPKGLSNGKTYRS